MPSVTVRNLDPEIHRRLRIRAAMSGRSMEGEIRAILEIAANQGRRRDKPDSPITEPVAKAPVEPASETDESAVRLTRDDAIAKVRDIIRTRQSEDAA